MFKLYKYKFDLNLFIYTCSSIMTKAVILIKPCWNLFLEPTSTEQQGWGSISCSVYTYVFHSIVKQAILLMEITLKSVSVTNQY